MKIGIVKLYCSEDPFPPPPRQAKVRSVILAKYCGMMPWVKALMMFSLIQRFSRNRSAWRIGD